MRTPDLDRRQALGGAVALSWAGARSTSRAAERLDPDGIVLNVGGTARQGGCLIGRTTPGARIVLDGESVGLSGATGLFIVGFDRDAVASAHLEVLAARGVGRRTLAVIPVTYDVQRINGLPTDQVAPSDPALLARIKAELERKTTAFESRDASENFADGFTWPVMNARRSSRFGGQRILNGVPKRPHYGVDLAAPAGTPILAPAPGLVVFVDPAMHFEGGLTLIDHGQGLITAYLHQSSQSVSPGQRIERGQEIGRIGMTGRATGPHLCWRMRWRGRNLDPSLLIGASAPA